MKSHQLKTGARQSRTRAGRGISAGRGKTAGRGTKGQNSRSGGKRRPGFEGGQNPLSMRLPKLRGFKSRASTPLSVTTDVLGQLKSKSITHETLVKAGLLDDVHCRVKVVLKGELNDKVTVKLDAASRGAIEAITKSGGVFEETAAPKRQKTKK